MGEHLNLTAPLLLRLGDQKVPSVLEVRILVLAFLVVLVVLEDMQQAHHMVLAAAARQGTLETGALEDTPGFAQHPVLAVGAAAVVAVVNMVVLVADFIMEGAQVVVV